MFCIEQTSFAATAIKYLASLIITAMQYEASQLGSRHAHDETRALGWVLVGIDSAVMLVGIGGLLGTSFLLRRELVERNRQSAGEDKKVGTKVTPSSLLTGGRTDEPAMSDPLPETTCQAIRTWQT